MTTITLLEEAQAAIAKLSNEDAGALVKALISGEDDPDLSVIAGIVYPFIKGQVERLEDIRAKRADSGQKGGSKKQTESKTEANDKQTESKTEALNHNLNHSHNLDHSQEREEKRTRFVPPTADQVSEYAQEKGLRLDAQRFVDFYASKGWKVGSSPMKDWRAAVRNWASRDKKESPPNTSPPPANPFFEQERRIKADQDMFRTNYAELEKIDYSKLLRTGGG